MPNRRVWQVLYNLQHPQSSHPNTHRGAAVLLLWAELWAIIRQCHQLQEPHEDTHRWVHLQTETFTTLTMKWNLVLTTAVIPVPPGEKPYVCTVPGCEKRFTEYSSLYKHHVVHTPCKPYNCNHCGKTYKQISTLAMHKRTAHNDTEPIEEEQEAYFEPPTGQCKHENLETHPKVSFLCRENSCCIIGQ